MKEKSTKAVHKCLSLLLVTAMFLTISGIPVLAETMGQETTAQGASYDSNGDALVDSMKYRRISKGDTNYDANFGDSEYCYCKWERIDRKPAIQQPFSMQSLHC